MKTTHQKFWQIHLLFIAFVLFSFLMSLHFNGNISFYQDKLDRVPTTMSWNVFLALIAYDAAYFLPKTKKRGLLILLSIIWLGFYPNTFYMMTDASHFADWLSIGGKFDLPLGVSSKQLTYFGILFIGIFMGVTLGLWSMLTVLERFFKNKKIIASLFVFVVSFLSSVGIFAGKLFSLRLNTWNLLTNPLETLGTLLGIIRPEYMTFLLGFTAMQALLILFFWLGKKEN
ncbi:DUF1361 domain-containing protein [Lactococcus kimchii]|uniref:DUF1361 domain-containing protein n=1 Tax=Lactococcus sp. S-13 TaxID=2507158 RepID=UPI001023EE3A|nr:DUF1361 domain-containing protein [Lactococcus sp. S-13]RZI48964.1 DUF1361 domain-containing protein [Lactococcus sp. S-13]